MQFKSVYLNFWPYMFVISFMAFVIVSLADAVFGVFSIKWFLCVIAAHFVFKYGISRILKIK
jgi:hypothetical protein